jgi:hypothetical protein
MAHEPTTIAEGHGRSGRPGTRRSRGRHLRIAATALTAALATSVLVGGTADAKMTSEASVECNGAYNTITVVPHVLSNDLNTPQYTATRVWIATYNSTTRTWQWEANPWKVEQASQTNSPIANDISRLSPQTFNKGDGYHYIYVQSYMWDGTKWYDPQGMYTRTYTQIQPSVSHDPEPTRTSSTICTL